MATEREIQETIARCVCIMVYYRNSEKTKQSKDLMTTEIGAVASCVKEWVTVEDPFGRILESVNDELIARYGYELGVRLDGEFYKAFKNEDMLMSGRLPSRD